MSTQLFFNRFPKDMPEEAIRYLFSQYGEVLAIELFKHRQTGETYGRGRVTLDSPGSAERAIEALNDLKIEGQPVRVKPYAHIHYKPKSRQSANPITQAANNITQQLNENDPFCRIIKQIIYVKGLEFAQSLLEETHQVEAQGGMLIQDGSRRRTPGGVYFYLLKAQIGRAAFLSLAYPSRHQETPRADQP